MRFVTVIQFNPYEKDIEHHATLEDAQEYLEKFSLGGTYGEDYFIAVIVERQFVVPKMEELTGKDEA